MAPSSPAFRPFTRGEADGTVPKSRTLRSARDWMPYLTVCFCVVGFTVVMMGYYETLPESQKTISIGGPNLTRAVNPSTSRCGEGVYFRGSCYDIAAVNNETVLAVYAVYYHVFAILGCLQHDVVFKIQLGWSVMGFALNLILGFGLGKHFLAPVLGPQYFLLSILFVLTVFKKGSGNWAFVSYLLGEHKEKPVDVLKSNKSDKPWMVENFSGIQIV